jgi:hypothetical protein
MSTTNWTSHPFIERFKKEGLKEGLAEAKAEDVLKLIDARGIHVTEDQRNQVTAAAGLTQLGKWFDRALNAETAADIFQA